MPMPKGATVAKVVDGAGGFAAVAAYLRGRFRTRVDRRQVHNWATRGTVNAAGQPFPGHLPEPRGKGSKWYVLNEVARWFAAGVPGPRGVGWVTPEPRE